MSHLPLLLELQSVHDNLRTIHRDLSALPPDLAQLDTELKTLARQREATEKALAEAEAQRTKLSAALVGAVKDEDRARAALKQTTQKVQYAAAIRELDEKERQHAAIARPLKEAEARHAALSGEHAQLLSRQAQAQERFDELHQVFLSEHENQVSARVVLERRRLELEALLPASELLGFTRLLQARQGRALVPVEGGICGGCRTKLRIPLMAQIRDHAPVPCESCMRLLYIPARA